MIVTAAKLIGAGVATVGLTGAGICIGTVCGAFLVQVELSARYFFAIFFFIFFFCYV